MFEKSLIDFSDMIILVLDAFENDEMFLSEVLSTRFISDSPHQYHLEILFSGAMYIPSPSLTSYAS